MISGYATVKEVLSGDTVVLIGQPKRGTPPPELRLNLASLQAPKVAPNRSDARDEPFAWQSREFLRNLCVGKAVTFKVEYVVQSIGRSFGQIRLIHGDNKENVCLTVARAGWARVKQDINRDNEHSADLEEMIRLQEAAKNDGLGIFSSDAPGNFTRTEETNAEELYNKIRGTAPQRALIEYVRDGASFKVLLLDSMKVVNFNLAGVLCPRLNQGGSSAGVPEPFAMEAKYFTEIRMLNREVRLSIQGVEKNTIYGQILHPAGNLSVELIRHGLAKLSYMTLKMCTADQAKILGELQRATREARLRVWRNVKSATTTGAGATKFDGVIAEVLSADCVIVRCGTAEEIERAPWACAERKVFLSSISAPRAPRRNNKNEEESGDAEADKQRKIDAYYSPLAREFLRQKVIGKRCSVSIEYERAGTNQDGSSDNRPSRQYGTVTVSMRKAKSNIAVMMIQEGLAYRVHHRRDSTEHSLFYDEIVKAFEDAKEARRGVHSGLQNVPNTNQIDLCNQPTKAKAHLPYLTRGNGLHKAVVDYCHNGARLKVTIPGENCTLNLALAGVNCPQRARAAQKARDGRNARAATPEQPFANEALAMTRALVLQREVEVHIETMDKGGTAIGSVFFTKSGQRHNLGATLLAQGLARVNEYSASLSAYGPILLEAEAPAKANRLRVWEKYDEELAAAKAAAEAAGTVETAPKNGNSLPTKTVVISEVVNGSSFYIQEESANAKKRQDEIAEAMKQVGEAHGVVAGAAGCGVVEPRAGKNCLALYEDQNGPQWFRASIVSVEDGGKAAKVRYVDFGNVEVVPMDRLRDCEAAIFTGKGPLASLCQLAFLKSPALNEDYGVEAAMRFNDLVWGKTLTAEVVANDQNVLQVILRLPEEEEEAADKDAAVEAVPEAAPEAGADKDEVTFPSQEPKAIAKSAKAAPSVNEIIVSDGLAMVANRVYAKSAPAKAYLKAVKAAQEAAHQAHLNMWEYGDVYGDDADEFGAR